VTISLDEVRRIAALARVGITEDRADAIAGELNGILAHMQALTAADTSDAAARAGATARRMPLRPDEGPPIPLAGPPADFAPSMRDGFFLVPRLATHEDPDPAP
jgi:aspartyl-tRNA(Asn)/glutamyl-tRNA(Gln) amidotransferase subunit C